MPWSKKYICSITPRDLHETIGWRKHNGKIVSIVKVRILLCRSYNVHKRNLLVASQCWLGATTVSIQNLTRVIDPHRSTKLMLMTAVMTKKKNYNIAVSVLTFSDSSDFRSLGFDRIDIGEIVYLLFQMNECCSFDRYVVQHRFLRRCSVRLNTLTITGRAVSQRSMNLPFNGANAL